MRVCIFFFVLSAFLSLLLVSQAAPVLAQNASQDALSEEMLAKSKTCETISPRKKESRNCVEGCRGIANQITKPHSPERIARMKKSCEDMYQKAGFGLSESGSAPVHENPQADLSDLDTRLQSVQEKQKFCAEKQSVLSCSMEAYSDTDGICYADRACKTYCSKRWLEIVLKSQNRPEKVKLGMERLEQCEQMYEKVRAHFGG